MKNNLLRKLVAPLVLASSLSFCTLPAPEPEPPIPVRNELSENTRVLTEQDAAQINYIDEDQINFTGSVNYSVGDIIASGTTASTPEGLLRKVTRVLDNIVYTEPTSLEEAVKNVTFSTSKNISRDITINSGVSLVDFNFDGSITYADNISIGGSVDFNSDLVFEIGIQNHHLNKLLIKNVINESSSISLTAGSSLTSVNQEFSLAPPYRFPPFIVYLPTVPPFPIIITPKLEVVAGIGGGISPVTVTATQSMNSELGVDYEEGSWNIINNLNFNPPTYSMNFADVANIKAYVGPKLDFLIYGAAGPYANLRGYLNLEGDTSGNYLDLYGGLEAILGVNMKLFSKTMFDFSMTSPLNFDWLLKRWERPVTPPTPPTPITITIQPGPEGKDAYIITNGYSNCTKNYSGKDIGTLEIWKNSQSSCSFVLEEALIEFPLSSIPFNSNIISARLKLYGSGATNYIPDPIIKIKKIEGSWDESTVNGSNKPLYGDYITDSTVGVTNWYEWNITSLVQRWINGEPNYGLVLYTTGNTSYSKFESSDSIDSNKRPTLEISYY